MLRQVLFPFVCLPVGMVFQEDGVRRLVGFAAKRHVGLLGCIIALFSIALFTGGNKICPRITTIFCAWYYVVNG